MKKMMLAALAAALVFSLCACGAKIIGIIPSYVGETVTDTQHEFSASDFEVLVNFSEGDSVKTSDFEFEVIGIENAIYVVEVRYKNFVEECYVPIEMDFYEK